MPWRMPSPMRPIITMGQASVCDTPTWATALSAAAR